MRIAAQDEIGHARGGMGFVDTAELIQLRRTTADCRTNKPRNNRRDLDCRASDLFGKRVGQALKRCERASVREHLIAGYKTARRRNVDQNPMPIGSAKQRHQRAGHAHHRDGADIAAAGRVDEHIDRAEFLSDLGSEYGHAILFDRVTIAREGVEALGGVRQRESIDVAQDELDICASERLGARKADSSGAAGHQDPQLLFLSGGLEPALSNDNHLRGPRAASRTNSMDMGDCTLLVLMQQCVALAKGEE